MAHLDPAIDLGHQVRSHIVGLMKVGAGSRFRAAGGRLECSTKWRDGS